jgi:hypothetical protein
LNVTKNAGIAYGERHNSMKSQKLLATDATHRAEALQGPCLADGLVPTSEFFPIRISIVPRSFRSKYKPKQEWDTNRAFPDIGILPGLPKPVVHKCTQFNHTDAVQYGKHKEECASEGDYRYDFEGWDDVSYPRESNKASDPQLLAARALQIFEKLFSKEALWNT